MDELTQNLISGRRKQVEILKEWMQTNDSIMAPVEVKIAVMNHIAYCREQIREFGGEVA
jgi:hypothetical protein